MKPAICIEWRSPSMATPAYEYFDPANMDFVNWHVRLLHARRIPLVVRCCEVPDHVRLVEEGDRSRG